jgi:hypothetical protein
MFGCHDSIGFSIKPKMKNLKHFESKKRQYWDLDSNPLDAGLVSDKSTCKPTSLHPIASLVFV